MKVVGQSTTSTRLPYFHLAYLAANNSPARMQGGFVVSGGLILFFGLIIFSKFVRKGYSSVYNILPSMSFKRRVAIGGLLLVIGSVLFIYGITTWKVEYYASFTMHRMGEIIEEYSNAHEGKLPDAENWCDDLITGNGRNIYFGFDDGDIMEGECGFAINENVAGQVLSELPGDVVLLFETDLGHNESERATNRWNQYGGREILTTRYNDGEGCDVLFADGRAEFVANAELDSLRWEVD